MKCIVFDVDDTLYKRSQPFTRAAIDIFGDRYLWDWDELYRIRNVYSEEIFHASETGSVSMEEMYEYRLGKAVNHFGYTTTREEVLSFEKRYVHYQSLIRLDPPFNTLFDELAAKNIPMAVLTNGPSEHQRNKIRALNLERWIPSSRWIVSGDHGTGKPHLEIFRKAETILGLNPEELIIIGDNYQADIIGGIRAGWNTIWYNHTQTDPAQYPDKATYECKTPDEIAQTLRFISEIIKKNIETEMN